jgi:hypothetical protein
MENTDIVRYANHILSLSKQNFCTAVPVHATKAYGMAEVEFHAFLTLIGLMSSLNRHVTSHNVGSSLSCGCL